VTSGVDLMRTAYAALVCIRRGATAGRPERREIALRLLHAADSLSREDAVVQLLPPAAATDIFSLIEADEPLWSEALREAAGSYFLEEEEAREAIVEVAAAIERAANARMQGEPTESMKEAIASSSVPLPSVERVDIALHVKQEMPADDRELAVVLPLDLVFAATGSEMASARDEPDVDATFHEGVMLGHEAALALLDQLAPPPEAMAAVAEPIAARIPALIGVGAPVRDRSAGLAVALATLRRAAAASGFDLGQTAAVATGAFARVDSTFVLERSQAVGIAEAKQRAVAEAMSWALIAPIDCSVTSVVDVSDLFQAATAMWGTRWTEWVERLADDWIRTRRSESFGSWEVLRDDTAIEQETQTELDRVDHAEHARMLAYFARDRGGAVLGDLPRSGKTTLALSVAQQLRSDGIVDHFVWLRCPVGDDIDWEELAETGAQAVLPYRKESVLLIVDGLDVSTLPIEGEGRFPLDESVDDLARTLSQRVLVVAIYTDDHLGPNFDTDGARTFHAWGGQGEEFARALATANGLQVRDATLHSCVRRSGGDVGILATMLLVAAAGAKGGPDEVALDLVRRLDSLSSPSREAVRRMAALSLLAIEDETVEAAGVSVADLRALGARKSDGRWQIPTAWMAARVAAGDTRPVRPFETAGLVCDYLMPLLDAPEDRRAAQRVALVLTRAARVDIGDRVLRKLGRMIVKWAERAPPGPVARVLLRARLELASDVRERLVQSLVNSLGATALVPSPAELGSVIEAVRRAAPHEEILAALESKLLDLIPAVIERWSCAAGGDRQYLLQSVARLRSPAAGNHILAPAHLEWFFGGLAERRVSDYRRARISIDVLRQYRSSWLVREDGSSRQHEVELAENAADGDASSASLRTSDPAADLLPIKSSVAKLLERPEQHSSIGVWLGWLGVCAALRWNPETGQTEARLDWERLIDCVHDDVVVASRVGSLSEVVAAVNFLSSFDRGIAVKLLRSTQLADDIAGRLCERVSFGVRADLIDLLRSVRADAAGRLLYDGDVPRVAIAMQLADEARADVDPRGVGRFLRTTAAVDEFYGGANGGFAHQFAVNLGRDYLEERLADEHRTSILFHLLEGFAVAAAPFLAKALDIVAARVAESLGTRKPWAPRLALLMAQLPEPGSGRFLGRLGQLLAIRRDDAEWTADTSHPLLRAMLEPRTAEAAVMTHRLAGALETRQQAFARAFRDNLPDAMKFAAGHARVHDVAELCGAVSYTLSRAGERHPARTALMRLDAAGWSWTDELRRTRDGNAVNLALRHLHVLDPPLAEKTAKALAEDDGNVQSAALRVVRRLAEYAPARATELMWAFEICAPGTGRALLAALLKNRYRWNRFVQDLCYEQEPALQAQGFKVLIRLGWPMELNIRKQLWDHRWAMSLPQLRSPYHIREMLSLISTWGDRDRIEAAVSAVYIPALAGRLREGAPRDVNMLARLLAAFRLLGREELARRLLDALAAESIRRVPGIIPTYPLTVARIARAASLAGIADLLHEYAELNEAALEHELQAVALDRLARAVSLRAVPEPMAHWRQVGLLAERLGDAARALPIAERMPMTLPPATASSALWACGWLPAGGWRDDVIDATTVTLVDRGTSSRPTALAVSLAVLAARGHAAEVVEADPNSWRSCVDAAPWALAALLRHATEDRVLEELLQAERVALEERLPALDQQARSLSPDAAEAATLIRRLVGSGTKLEQAGSQSDREIPDRARARPNEEMTRSRDGSSPEGAPNWSGSDGTRTRDLRRDRPAF
jgi:hypothetical protein